MEEKRKPWTFYTGRFPLLVAEPSLYEYAVEGAALNQIFEAILDIAKVMLDRIRATGDLTITIKMHDIRRYMRAAMYAWEIKDRWALIQTYKAIQGV